MAKLKIVAHTCSTAIFRAASIGCGIAGEMMA
jgi:hypothetical protein